MRKRDAWNGGKYEKDNYYGSRQGYGRNHCKGLHISGGKRDQYSGYFPNHCIAKVCTYLAENEINILDISQTIVQGYFNMMMIVDTGKMKKDFGGMADELGALGHEIGVVIK